MDGLATLLWSCKECDTPLVRESDRIAYLNFTGHLGPGYLFHSAFNVRFGDLYQKDMTTGRHAIRDIRCVKCNAYVGWRYEAASVEAESYKLGKFLLEGAMLQQAGSTVMYNSRL